MLAPISKPLNAFLPNLHECQNLPNHYLNRIHRYIKQTNRPSYNNQKPMQVFVCSCIFSSPFANCLMKNRMIEWKFDQFQFRKYFLIRTNVWIESIVIINMQKPTEISNFSCIFLLLHHSEQKCHVLS